MRPLHLHTLQLHDLHPQQANEFTVYQPLTTPVDAGHRALHARVRSCRITGELQWCCSFSLQCEVGIDYLSLVIARCGALVQYMMLFASLGLVPSLIKSKGVCALQNNVHVVHVVHHDKHRLSLPSVLYCSASLVYNISCFKP